MNRRLILLASLLFATLAFVSVSTVSAQAIDTCCVRINNGSNCHITVCVRLPDGSIRCETVMGNSNDGFRFLCDSSTAFAVTDACGNLHRLPMDGTCIRVALRGGCCTRVCLRREDGCFVVGIRPLDIDCPCAPDGLE